MWTWPHYVVCLWQILLVFLVIVDWWLADDELGLPKYSWGTLIRMVVVLLSFTAVFNWVLAQGGFWP